MNSKHCILSLFLALAFPLLLSANAAPINNPNYAVSNISDSLLEKANTVIRFSKTTFMVENTAKAKEKIRKVITILNANSKQDNLLVYYDQFKKVGKIKARLYDQTGKKIRDINKSEVNDFAAYDGFSIYNDLRVKQVDLTYGRYPYTIEYEYEIEHNGLQSYPTWSPQNSKTSLVESYFYLQLPASMTFRYKAMNLSEEPATKEIDGNKAYSWQIKNQKVILVEDFTPDTYHPFPLLFTLPNDFEVDGYKGNMESWESFGKFMYELNVNRDKLSPEMVKAVNMMTANAATNQEKIEILYNYLQENMRYVSVQLGIGGWQTFDAAYVEKNKYGDCKALTNFMKGMLHTAGIKAHAALISAGSQRLEIKEDFTVPYFNHVILNIPEEDIWLECTSTDNPVNYLGSNTENRPTLLITEEGGILTTTPAITENNQVGKTQITLVSDGSAEIKCETQFSGRLHEVIRYLTNNYAQEDQEKWFKGNQAFPTFDIEKLELSASKNAPEAECNYKIKVNRYASKAGKRLFVPLNLINQMGRSLPKVKDRKQPISFELGYQDADEITFIIPADYKVESIPKNIESISSPYGTYQIEIEENEGSIVYKRKLTLNPIEVSPTEYQSVRDFYKKIAKFDSAKLVLIKKTT